MTTNEFQGYWQCEASEKVLKIEETGLQYQYKFTKVKDENGNEQENYLYTKSLDVMDWTPNPVIVINSTKINIGGEIYNKQK
ncbi:hypothetical protein [Sunxiuqinia indica]|uniref:hypothetical protein n=1 Tax=Sunxiuqinia indica TaxID=2692584 RepID=UPI001359C4A2|nr:hypothetical protein [Sunxiuqinia indica]